MRSAWPNCVFGCAGSSHADGRLSYLPEQAALDLRARLLAAHHGLDPDTPEPGERVLASVPTGRLAGSVLASGASLLIALLVAELVVILVWPAVLAATGGTFLIFLITLVPMVWRRLATEYGFTLAQSPDGIRIRRGLLGTVAETIPLRRVQAVRMVEPLLWRPLGWCRLEIDVAGLPGPGSCRRVGPDAQDLAPRRPSQAGLAADAAGHGGRPAPGVAAAGAGPPESAAELSLPGRRA